MATRHQIILTVFFIIYLSTVLLTDISLVGFWTDVVFSILFSMFSLIIVFKNRTTNNWLTILIRTTTVILSVIVFGVMCISLTSPFITDHFKMRSFYFQKVDGRIFNAYFKPVGSYSGGQGNFWITESPVFFPLIETRVYYDRTVHHDFNDDMWDGEPIDNYEVVKSYIKREIIEK
jgi:hypothetical protein